MQLSTVLQAVIFFSHSDQRDDVFKAVKGLTDCEKSMGYGLWNGNFRGKYIIIIVNIIVIVIIIYVYIYMNIDISKYVTLLYIEWDLTKSFNPSSPIWERDPIKDVGM